MHHGHAFSLTVRALGEESFNKAQKKKTIHPPKKHPSGF